MIADLRGLVAYLREFHRSWSDSPGLDPALIPSDLPDGLSLLYRELGALVEIEPIPGNERTPFAAQDALMPLSRLKRIDGMIEFACENQGNWLCRCPLGRGDPPVYSNAADSWQSERKGFQKVCDSLNHFLTTLCLQEAVMSAPCLLAVDGDTPEEVLRAPCIPLWLSGYYVFGEPTHSFYEVSDCDILIMDYAGLWLGSHGEAALKMVKAGVQYNRLC
jgi:hypothetical protein